MNDNGKTRLRLLLFIRCPTMALPILAGLFLSGCSGMLFTSRTLPLSTDFAETPIGSKTIQYNRHKLKEPFSGYGANITFTNGRIESEARKAGMTKIYYADEKVFSLLFGLYEHRVIILHGD